MISASSNKGFFAAHWDWLVAALAILAFAGSVVFAFLEFSNDPDALADDIRNELAGAKRSDTGVEKVNLDAFYVAQKEVQSPTRISEPAESLASFLASERRVYCEQGDDPEHKSCGRPMPADLKVCPFCQTKQPVEKKVSLDSDGDGLSDEYELSIGLNPNDPSDANADLDGDGFTNMEEFLAKTDPQDPTSHPDYLDSLSITGELQRETLSFFFEKASKIPSGYRLYFKDPKKKNDYGKLGLAYSVVKGEDIGKTGFVAGDYFEKKEEKSIKGGQGMKKTIDVSEVEVTRKRDKKVVRLRIGEKNYPIDVKATLVYNRLETKQFEVVPGDEIDLNGSKYRVKEIKETKSQSGTGTRVVLVEVATGRERALDTLEQ